MFIKCPCTCDHEYPSMHGRSSIVASRFRCKLMNLNFPNQWGITHVYAPTATPLTPYFNPLHQPKTPVFYQKIVTQSPVFSTLSKILETVHSKIPNRLEKRYLNASYFYGFCHRKTPNFLPCMQVFEGNVAPSNTVRSWKILYSWDRIVQFTFRCKFNKGDENKIQFYRLNRPNYYWRTSLEGRDNTQVIIPWSDTEGDISYNHPLYDFAPPGSLNKCQVYLKLCEQRHFKCKVQYRARWRAWENFEI